MFYSTQAKKLKRCFEISKSAEWCGAKHDLMKHDHSVCLARDINLQLVKCFLPLSVNVTLAKALFTSREGNHSAGVILAGGSNEDSPGLQAKFHRRG